MGTLRRSTMNKTSTLIVLALVAISQFFGGHAENDCENVTVGECLIPPEDVIQTIDIFTEVEDCQFYCNALTNCELFRFDGQNCTIMTKDYRKDCQVVAAPFDKLIDECFEIDNKLVCDLFLQEDCGYTGEVLLEPPVGTIADPQECEELCNQFNALGCKYWIFSQTEKKCSLRTAQDRDCKTWGGPRAPLFDDCFGDSTTGAPNPTTAKPATTSKAPAPTTSKASAPTTEKDEATTKKDGTTSK